MRRLGVGQRAGGRGRIFGHQRRGEACHVGRSHPANPQRLRQRPRGQRRGGGGASGWRPHVRGCAERRRLRGDFRRAQRRLCGLWRPLEATSAPSRKATCWYLAGGGGKPRRWSAARDECDGGEAAAAQGLTAAACCSWPPPQSARRVGAPAAAAPVGRDRRLRPPTTATGPTGSPTRCRFRRATPRPSPDSRLTAAAQGGGRRAWARDALARRYRRR